jgi:hypothetical protein
MPRRPSELSGPPELIEGATLGLPLRGLSCPASNPRDIQPPYAGVLPTPGPDRRGAREGRGAADPRPGGAVFALKVPASDAWKQPPGARSRVLAAMLGLALAAVLAYAARRSSALRNHIKRRSR